VLKTIRVKPVSFIYFMYCGQSGYFLNKPRIQVFRIACVMCRYVHDLICLDLIIAMT
jgi:hypothetical protein